jgi:hypothetical protein
VRVMDEVTRSSKNVRERIYPLQTDSAIRLSSATRETLST